MEFLIMNEYWNLSFIIFFEDLLLGGQPYRVGGSWGAYFQGLHACRFKAGPVGQR
jgi:hypothetical protein